MVGTGTATTSLRRAAAKAEEGRLLVERVAEAEAAKSTAQASGSRLVGRVAANIGGPLCAAHFWQVSGSEGCAMLVAVESVTPCVQAAALWIQAVTLCVQV